MKRHPEEKNDGKVIDAITGAPIEGVEVSLPDGYTGITGADGRVTEWHRTEGGEEE